MFLYKILFFGSIFLLLYVYVGYPFLTLLVGKIKKNDVKRGFYEPDVSILIAAYNEEKYIEATIRNKLELDYPSEKLEVIIISDNSIDNTNNIIKKFEGDRCKLLNQRTRKGKTSALNKAIKYAKGEILIFSDANSIYAKDAVRKLVENFKDPLVGYVTGKMIYTNSMGNTIGDGCSAYMKYENLLKEMETKVGSIVGVDGGIDAVRKNLYYFMRPDQLPDFILPLKVVEQGYRVVYEKKAILHESALNKSKDEYKMRVRVSLRAFWALKDMKHLLNLREYKYFALQLWSHKLLRYMCFIFLAMAFLPNLALVSENKFYALCFLGQILFYLVAIISFILEKITNRFRLFYPFQYFVLLNLSAAHAFIKFIMGKKQVIWTPRI